MPDAAAEEENRCVFRGNKNVAEHQREMVARFCECTTRLGYTVHEGEFRVQEDIRVRYKMPSKACV